MAHETVSAALPHSMTGDMVAILEVLLSTENVHSSLRDYGFHYVVKRDCHFNSYLQVHSHIDAQQ